MDLRKAIHVAAKVASGRWFVVFACLLIMSCAGGTYIFGLYSDVIKTTLGYDQQTLDTLGFFKDLGGNVGILSGLINEVTPPWVVLAVGSVMNLTGYVMIWLSVQGRIARPRFWQMCLYICIGANSQTFANTGALVTCVKNFPQSRGVVLGLLKGYVGLSGAIFTQMYHALYGGHPKSLILLIAWLPSAVSLIFMFIVRPTKVRTEKNELKRFYHFLYIALALAGFLMVLIVVENHIHFSSASYKIVAMAAIILLLLSLVVVFRAEIAKMKEAQNSNLDGSSSLSLHKAIEVNQIEVQKKPVLVTEHNGSVAELRLEKTSTAEANEVQRPDPESNGEVKTVSDATHSTKEIRGSIMSRIIEIFKAPTRGEDFTIPQALVSLDMLIIFVATTCGVGSTLTAIDNMGQIGKALGYTQVNISTFVSLISIWNCLGRVMSGFVSEYLLQKYRFPRPLVFSIILGIACIGHTFIAFSLPGSLYIASVLIGLCFGAQWPIIFAVISELFGLKYYSTLYNFGGAASPLGSYLLSVKVAGYLYDREAKRQLGVHASSSKIIRVLASPAPAPSKSDLTCTGQECFRLTFIIMIIVTLFGSLINGVLVLRTREFYKSDIYAKFREAERKAAEETKGACSPSDNAEVQKEKKQINQLTNIEIKRESTM